MAAATHWPAYGDGSKGSDWRLGDDVPAAGELGEGMAFAFVSLECLPLMASSVRLRFSPTCSLKMRVTSLQLRWSVLRRIRISSSSSVHKDLLLDILGVMNHTRDYGEGREEDFL